MTATLTLLHSVLCNVPSPRFTEDTMVIPRESEWFGAFQAGAESTVIPMEQQPIYTEDWIGLKQLNATNRLKLIVWSLERKNDSWWNRPVD